MAKLPKVAPKAREPVSPIKILAGFKLNKRKLARKEKRYKYNKELLENSKN